MYNIYRLILVSLCFFSTLCFAKTNNSFESEAKTIEKLEDLIHKSDILIGKFDYYTKNNHKLINNIAKIIKRNTIESLRKDFQSYKRAFQELSSFSYKVMFPASNREIIYQDLKLSVTDLINEANFLYDKYFDLITYIDDLKSFDMLDDSIIENLENSEDECEEIEWNVYDARDYSHHCFSVFVEFEQQNSDAKKTFSLGFGLAFIGISAFILIVPKISRFLDRL